MHPSAFAIHEAGQRRYVAHRGRPDSYSFFDQGYQALVKGAPLVRDLERLGEPRLLEYGVRSMPRQNFAVDSELSPSGRIDPDFVIAFSIADETTACGSEQFL
jgi:hypothetical protein